MNKKFEAINEECPSEKEKVTLTLPSWMIETIDEILFYARKEIPREKRKQLTKSKLHEILLDSILKNHTKTGEDSILTKIVFNWADS